ncbi:MAG TPA: lipopolysaccharide heptosyltransferase I [Casimicrobiaceae bacterium]|nr:lipopolysaccharide heptosyltransferase I [Casimicrobiaceae bacterium]
MLVVRPSSLGDVVHALPVAADIVRAIPEASVDWLAEEAFAPLVELNAHIHAVIPVALRRWRHHLLEASTWREMLAFRRTLRRVRYDAIIDLQEQVKGATMARLARGTVHGYDRSSIREPVSTWLHGRHHGVGRELHFGERCRALVGRALGYEPRGTPDYDIVAPRATPGLLPPGRYAVVVHVTSRDDKRWPDPQWHAVIGALERAGIDVLLPWGSAAERERSAALARGHARASVPPHRPLVEMATVLAHADIVVGVDTGLVHLAAALRAPTVAIFTTTDARLAGVSLAGPHAIDLGGNGDIPAADDVISAVGRLFAAAPRC